MYHPIFIFIGLRYLWNSNLKKFKKFIIFLSIITITISISFLIIITAIINGVQENFKKNILSFIPHLVITNKDQYINKLEFPKNILKLNNIEKISPFIKKDIFIKSKYDITVAEIVGVNINNDKNIKNYNIKNISKILQPKKYNAIIGKELAKKLHVNIGDTIQLILLFDTTSPLTRKNIKTHTFKITSIFSTNNEVDYYQILIDQKDSKNFLNYSKNYVTGWRIWLKNPLFLEINKIKKLINPLILFDWKSKKGELFKAIQIEKYIMFFLFFLFLLVAFLNIFITFIIYTIEKQNTIAILKSQGLLDWKIILIFVTLGLITTTIGSILGTVISISLILEKNFLNFLIHFFFNTNNISMIIIPYHVFFINITVILLAILSTLYPAWYSIKLKPYRILSHE
ncbi:Ycfu [Buchnera aphidicola str. G002 (Myzus persicae)]|uniref:FtsX-like permease family protein n=1 Tax=Buchnera aphidicola TaxID=9 RepID=UPI0003E32C3D|nr:FtsX-like permease family protein [Buchnera aphidicola]AHG61239.1 Ycfu [Buchnera aphidicola str. G002 (Myzus persicae)]